MIGLTDEEILAVLEQHAYAFEEATGILNNAGRGIAKAQLKKVVDEWDKYAKAYDMRIDGFVISWEVWQALLEEVKDV